MGFQMGSRSLNLVYAKVCMLFASRVEALPLVEHISTVEVYGNKKLYQSHIHIFFFLVLHPHSTLVSN